MAKNDNYVNPHLLYAIPSGLLPLSLSYVQIFSSPSCHKIPFELIYSLNVRYSYKLKSVGPTVYFIHYVFGEQNEKKRSFTECQQAFQNYKLLQSIRDCSSDLSLSVPNILTWLHFRIIYYIIVLTLILVARREFEYYTNNLASV